VLPYRIRRLPPAVSISAPCVGPLRPLTTDRPHAPHEPRRLPGTADRSPPAPPALHPHRLVPTWLCAARLATKLAKRPQEEVHEPREAKEKEGSKGAEERREGTEEDRKRTEREAGKEEIPAIPSSRGRENRLGPRQAPCRTLHHAETATYRYCDPYPKGPVSAVKLY